MPPNVFKNYFESAQSIEQRSMLKGLTAQRLGLKPDEFYDFYSNLENSVKSGKAEQIYWPKRAELEQAARQRMSIEIDER